jgi:hypothetical protein
MKLDALTYCVKIWLSTLLIAPIFVIAGKLMLDKHFLEPKLSLLFVIYAVEVMLSLVFSLPSVLMFWILTYGLTIVKVKVNYKKLILCIASSVLTIMSFSLIYTTLNAIEFILIAATYYLVIIVGIWYYKFSFSQISNDLVLSEH